MSKERKSWILLVFLSSIWGGSFILMKLSMYTSDEQPIFSDKQVAAMRMTIAGLVLLPFAIKGLARLKSWKNVLLLAIVGLSGNFFPAFLFTYAETGLSSGYTGMLNSFTPIFTLIISFIVFRNELSKVQFIGIFIGTLGIVFLMLSGSNLSLSGGWLHIFAIILATLFYGISLNMIKYTLQHLKSHEISSLSFLLILLPSIFISWNENTIGTIQSNPFAIQGLIAITILSVLGTAIAVVLFNKLITNSTILFASSVTYLIPIFAVIFSLAFGENINAYQILSMLVILVGIFIANYLPRILKKNDELRSLHQV